MQYYMYGIHGPGYGFFFHLPWWWATCWTTQRINLIKLSFLFQNDFPAPFPVWSLVGFRPGRLEEFGQIWPKRKLLEFEITSKSRKYIVILYGSISVWDVNILFSVFTFGRWKEESCCTCISPRLERRSPTLSGVPHGTLFPERKYGNQTTEWTTSLYVTNVAVSLAC